MTIEEACLLTVLPSQHVLLLKVMTRTRHGQFRENPYRWGVTETTRQTPPWPTRLLKTEWTLTRHICDQLVGNMKRVDSGVTRES